MTTAQENEFSRIFRLDELPGTGRASVTLEAHADERAALAERLSLLALDHLHAELRLRRIRDGVRIAGRFSARGSQACVVTFEPVAFAIEEPIELALYRKAALAQKEQELEETLSGEAIDLDLLEGDEIDLGEIVAQSLSLALPAYPRAPHADRVLERYAPPPREGRAGKGRDEAANPFAALGKLLHGRDGGRK